MELLIIMLIPTCPAATWALEGKEDRRKEGEDEIAADPADGDPPLNWPDFQLPIDGGMFRCAE
jgi:hypothetical protein